MREFLNHYGIWAAFLLAILENDVSFIAIGVVARLGDGDAATPDEFQLFPALAAAIVGALIHDSIWFFIGYRHSEWFKSSKVYQRIGPTVERFADRFGPWEIFFARFVYGTRNPTSVFWGIHHLRYATFAGIELLALTLWGGLLATIGFNFTSLALRIIGRVERHHHSQFLIIALIVALVAVFYLRWLNRRRIAKIHVPPSRAVTLCAVGIIAAFFMPWVHFLGRLLTGYQLSMHNNYSFVWLFPIMAGFTIGVGVAGHDNRPLGVITGALPLLTVLGGSIWLQAGAYNLQEIFSIGVYLMIVLSVLILFCSAQLKRPQAAVAPIDTPPG